VTQADPVPASGEEAPREEPRPTFDALPLSDEVRRALADVGYANPTPVQLAVWDPATRGKDAVVQARTGTGKTASFGLPIIDHVVKRAQPGVQSLVLCPTRELAVQVSQELERLAKYKETKIVAIYGGASMERQVQAIAGGAQVVVGTPGRVLDHLRRRTLSAESIRLLVLDEADEMLSMGFEKELTAILDHLPKSRQTLLFSATVPPDIERISKNKLKDPEFVTLSGDHVGALSITHFVYMIAAEKIASLARILEIENPESAVIFCNTKDETQAVAEALSSRGFDADWLNGDLPQSEREEVMRRTKEGRLRFLVATDVAARGIDISHLTHVINHDFPQDAETYVHRTGRTGRAGRTGTAIALVTPQDIGGLYLLRLTYKIKPIERTLPTAVELKTRAEADLIAMLAEAMLPKGAHPDDRALARRLLTHDQLEGILAGLLREFLGARPNAQEEASQSRRTTVRRATLKRRGDDRGERSAEPRSAEPRGVEGGPEAAASPSGEDPRERRPSREPRPPREPREGRDAREPRREPRRDREASPAQAGPVSNAPVEVPQAETVEPAATPRESAAAPRESAAAPRDLEGRVRRRDRREDRGERPRFEGSDIRPARARDFASWEPQPEAGDDEPIIPSRSDASRSEEARSADTTEQTPDADFVELFVGVGRRDGARAQDLLKCLVDTAGLDKDNVRRIRVRDRHAFVAVRKQDAEGAIAKLAGQQLFGKASVLVEIAREQRMGAESA
jgi:ATP-dependent RNA helicase DeaD